MVVYNFLTERLKLIAAAIAGMCLLHTSPSLAGDSSARRTMQTIGDCVILGREATALEVFLKPTPPSGYKCPNNVLLCQLPQCLDRAGAGSIRLSPWDFDSIVADSLVRHFYKSEDIGDLGEVIEGATSRANTIVALSDLPTDRSKRDDAFKRYLSALSSAFLITVTECVVRRDAASVRAFLLADAGSTDEETKFKALAPDFQACQPQDSSVQFSMFYKRGWLAINYLKLADVKAKGPNHA